MKGEGVARGAAVLREVLEKRTLDLRRVGVEGFRAWLEGELPRWRRDPVFAQRERVRELRRAWPRLRELEREERRAAEADAASAEGARLRAVEEDLTGVQKAVAGLSAALAGGADAVREAKLASFLARRVSLEAEHAQLSAGSPERQALLRVRAALERVRHESGWSWEEGRLWTMLRAHGRRSTRSGGGFEAAALGAVRAHLLPGLGGDALLTGVTLGAADLELDALVVRRGDPAEVLAVVEAKRNPNDVAHGFVRRQADLAWLTGDAGAPPRPTRAFPTGRFGRAEHEGFVLAPASFRRFRRGTGGHFLDGLCFATRPGRLVGLSGAAQGRLRHRAATDERFNPRDDAYLAELLAWTRALALPIETPDVLALYAADDPLAGQILWLG